MDYEAMVRYRNTHNPYGQRLGIVVEEISAGYSRVTKKVEAEDLNPLGVPHGGVYMSMADTACGSAAASHGRMAVTVSSVWNFLRSGRSGDFLTAEAREVKTGRTICVYDVSIRDQDGALLGTGTFTFYLLEELIPY